MREARRIPPKRTGSQRSKPPRSIKPPRRKKSEPRCIHLGEPTADSVAVTCRCSAGSTTRHYRVYACALFGECLPDYRCTKEALAETMEPRQIEHACRLCERFEASDPATPSAKS